jgi:hypothetical protein
MHALYSSVLIPRDNNSGLRLYIPDLREGYHDDFNKNLDGAIESWSDIGFTAQYKGWTSSAYGK